MQTTQLLAMFSWMENRSLVHYLSVLYIVGALRDRERERDTEGQEQWAIPAAGKGQWKDDLINRIVMRFINR